MLAVIVGTVSARKGHDVLLDALDLAQREVPGLHLAIAGEAPADQVEFRDRLRARAVPQVHWLGYRRDIPEILAASDLLVLPSRHEGMGRVCAEAMLMGRPVIGTRETGIADIVSDGNTGYLVTPGSVSELAQRLVTLARDADLRRRMGDAGSRFAHVELDADHQHARVLAALRELAGC